MGFEYRRAGEGLAAERTAEGALARVNAAMVLHVVPQLEGLAAEFALEGPVACVGGQVRDQRADVGERFAAEFAQGARRRRFSLDEREGRVVGRWRADDSVAGEVAPAPVARRRRRVSLQRVHRMTEQMPRQFALMREGGSAIHARIH